MIASEFKSLKRSSISLFVFEETEEGLSIKIDIQFSKVFNLWDPQDSIKCLHLLRELYFSRSDNVPIKLSLGLLSNVKNNSFGLIKILILFDDSGLLRAK